jgi:SAM-dependent methyltransferase
MDETPEINVEKIMERIRENIRKRRQEPAVPTPTPLVPPDQFAADLGLLHSHYDIYHLHFTSHRRALGRLVVSAKKLLRTLLTPILERQVAYNGANARVASAFWEYLAKTSAEQASALQALHTGLQRLQMELQRLQAELPERLQGLSGELEGVRIEQQRLRTEGQRLQAELQRLQSLRGEFESGFAQRDARAAQVDKTLMQLKTHLILQERRVAMLLEEARKRLPAPLNGAQLQAMEDERAHLLDALYVTFEDQFRGTRQDIKGRFAVYLPLLKEAKLGTDRMPIVDLGCGRGEWLELLQEEGMQARGVDRNRILLAECRQRGLEVVESDVLAYLHSLPDACLGAVTGFHLLEHLPFEALIAVLDETVRVLKPGGAAIFETPNPENVLVGSYTFYLDPTHRNPLPGPMLQFLVEARGLCRVEVMKLHPQPEALRVKEHGLEVAQRFNEYFYGPQDYAVIGWKA